MLSDEEFPEDIEEDIVSSSTLNEEEEEEEARYLRPLTFLHLHHARGRGRRGGRGGGSVLPDQEENYAQEIKLFQWDCGSEEEEEEEEERRRRKTDCERTNRGEGGRGGGEIDLEKDYEKEEERRKDDFERTEGGRERETDTGEEEEEKGEVKDIHVEEEKEEEEEEEEEDNQKLNQNTKIFSTKTHPHTPTHLNPPTPPHTPSPSTPPATPSPSISPGTSGEWGAVLGGECGDDSSSNSSVRDRSVSEVSVNIPQISVIALTPLNRVTNLVRQFSEESPHPISYPGAAPTPYLTQGQIHGPLHSIDSSHVAEKVEFFAGQPLQGDHLPKRDETQRMIGRLSEELKVSLGRVRPPLLSAARTGTQVNSAREEALKNREDFTHHNPASSSSSSFSHPSSSSSPSRPQWRRKNENSPLLNSPSIQQTPHSHSPRSSPAPITHNLPSSSSSSCLPSTKPDSRTVWRRKRRKEEGEEEWDSERKEEEEEEEEENSARSEDKSAIDEDNSAIEEDNSAMEENSNVDEDNSAIGEDNSAIGEDKCTRGEYNSAMDENSAIHEDNSAVDEVNSAIEEDSSAIEENSDTDEHNSAIGEDSSAIDEEKSAINEDNEDNSARYDENSAPEEKNGVEKENSEMDEDNSAVGEDNEDNSAIDEDSSARHEESSDREENSARKEENSDTDEDNSGLDEDNSATETPDSPPGECQDTENSQASPDHSVISAITERTEEGDSQGSIGTVGGTGGQVGGCHSASLPLQTVTHAPSQPGSQQDSMLQGYMSLHSTQLPPPSQVGNDSHHSAKPRVKAQLSLSSGHLKPSAIGDRTPGTPGTPTPPPLSPTHPTNPQLTHLSRITSRSLHSLSPRGRVQSQGQRSRSLSGSVDNLGTPTRAPPTRARGGAGGVGLGRRCVSTAALDQEGARGGVGGGGGGGGLRRAHSTSLSSVGGAGRGVKLPDYSHVQGKVRQYIRDIKEQQSARNRPPSRSLPTTPARRLPQRTPRLPITSALDLEHLLNLSSAEEDELSPRLKKIRREILEWDGGQKGVLKEVLGMLMEERRCRHTSDTTLAALQLQHDNLNAMFAEKQNEIDRLRFLRTQEINKEYTVTLKSSSSDLLPNTTSPYSTPPNPPRPSTHPLTLTPSQISLSAPCLIRATSTPIADPNLSLTFDPSGMPDPLGMSPVLGGRGEGETTAVKRGGRGEKESEGRGGRKEGKKEEEEEVEEGRNEEMVKKWKEDTKGIVRKVKELAVLLGGQALQHSERDTIWHSILQEYWKVCSQFPLITLLSPPHHTGPLLQDAGQAIQAAATTFSLQVVAQGQAGTVAFHTKPKTGFNKQNFDRNISSDFRDVSTPVDGFQDAPGVQTDPQGCVSAPRKPQAPQDKSTGLECAGSSNKINGFENNNETVISHVGTAAGVSKGDPSPPQPPNDAPGECRGEAGACGGDATTPSPAHSQQSMKTVGPLEKVKLWQATLIDPAPPPLPASPSSSSSPSPAPSLLSLGSSQSFTPESLPLPQAPGTPVETQSGEEECGGGVAKNLCQTGAFGEQGCHLPKQSWRSSSATPRATPRTPWGRPPHPRDVDSGCPGSEHSTRFSQNASLEAVDLPPSAFQHPPVTSHSLPQPLTSGHSLPQLPATHHSLPQPTNQPHTLPGSQNADTPSPHPLPTSHSIPQATEPLHSIPQHTESPHSITEPTSHPLQSPNTPKHPSVSPQRSVCSDILSIAFPSSQPHSALSNSTVAESSTQHTTADGDQGSREEEEPQTDTPDSPGDAVRGEKEKNATGVGKLGEKNLESVASPSPQNTRQCHHSHHSHHHHSKSPPNTSYRARYRTPPTTTNTTNTTGNTSVSSSDIYHSLSKLRRDFSIIQNQMLSGTAKQHKQGSRRPRRRSRGRRDAENMQTNSNTSKRKPVRALDFSYDSSGSNSMILDHSHSQKTGQECQRGHRSYPSYNSNYHDLQFKNRSGYDPTTALTSQLRSGGVPERGQEGGRVLWHAVKPGHSREQRCGMDGRQNIVEWEHASYSSSTSSSFSSPSPLPHRHRYHSTSPPQRKRYPSPAPPPHHYHTTTTRETGLNQTTFVSQPQYRTPSTTNIRRGTSISPPHRHRPHSTPPPHSPHLDDHTALHHHYHNRHHTTIPQTDLNRTTLTSPPHYRRPHSTPPPHSPQWDRHRALPQQSTTAASPQPTTAPPQPQCQSAKEDCGILPSVPSSLIIYIQNFNPPCDGGSDNHHHHNQSSSNGSRSRNRRRTKSHDLSHTLDITTRLAKNVLRRSESLLSSLSTLAPPQPSTPVLTPRCSPDPNSDPRCKRRVSAPPAPPAPPP